MPAALAIALALAVLDPDAENTATTISSSSSCSSSCSSSSVQDEDEDEDEVQDEDEDDATPPETALEPTPTPTAAPTPTSTPAALSLPPREAEVARVLAAAPPGPARAALAARALLGTPYATSPLGEGAGRDPDPRFRLDAFDCMTFVETALALGSATSLDEARLALDDVRYDGAPDWTARNHEVLSQWIPRNVAKGWVAPIALPPPGGGPPHVAAKEYTAATWAAVRAAGRALPGIPAARLPLGRFEVPVVRPGEAAAAAPLLPEVAVVFVLRADAPERLTRVTHAGLVVRGAGGAPLVRHATSTRGVRRVIEEPLARFLARQQAAYPGWPVEGLAFFSVGDASARVRTLAAAATPRPAAAEVPPAPPLPPQSTPPRL